MQLSPIFCSLLLASCLNMHCTQPDSCFCSFYAKLLNPFSCQKASLPEDWSHKFNVRAEHVYPKPRNYRHPCLCSNRRRQIPQRPINPQPSRRGQASALQRIFVCALLCEYFLGQTKAFLYWLTLLTSVCYV